jgi:predicted nucleic acid-binding protein
MRFWDSSAILPLLVPETRTPALEALVRDDPAMVTWWATPVECRSALARLERDRRLDRRGCDDAERVLDAAARQWIEVPPTAAVREQACRMLRVHPLRAAEAMQLAAALVAAEFEPRSLPFITLDARLSEAAAREGFTTETAGPPGPGDS